MELWWTHYCKYFSILLTDAMIKKNYSFCVFKCIRILTRGVVRGTFLDRSPLRCRNVVAEGGCRLEWARCPDEQSAPDAWTERTQSRVDVCGFMVPGSEPAVPAVLRLQIRSPGPSAWPGNTDHSGARSAPWAFAGTAWRLRTVHAMSSLMPALYLPLLSELWVVWTSNITPFVVILNIFLFLANLHFYSIHLFSCIIYIFM